MKSQPLVSVVTPVYNTEKYLAQCIESVLSQTYQNWEYIIVDNCSTDRTSEIAKSYARKDPRIGVHRNRTFLNLMPNWNHAMRQISSDSKYCKVIHADDWLFPECLTRMVEIGETYPSVGVVGAYRLEEEKVTLDGLPYPTPFISGRETCRLFFLKSLYLFGSPSSVLLRSDLVRKRDPFYNESNLHADLEACFELLQESDFGFVHQILTFTRRHNESITTTFSRRINTYWVGVFTVLIKHGPKVLSLEEFQARLKRALRGYHRFLAQKIFELKSEEFWQYHSKALKALGYPISYPRLVLAIIVQLSNIEQTSRRLVKAFREKRGFIV